MLTWPPTSSPRRQARARGDTPVPCDGHEPVVTPLCPGDGHKPTVTPPCPLTGTSIFCNVIGAKC